LLTRTNSPVVTRSWFFTQNKTCRSIRTHTPSLANEHTGVSGTNTRSELEWLTRTKHRGSAQAFSGGLRVRASGSQAALSQLLVCVRLNVLRTHCCCCTGMRGERVNGRSPVSPPLSSKQVSSPQVSYCDVTRPPTHMQEGGGEATGNCWPAMPAGLPYRQNVSNTGGGGGSLQEEIAFK
jgi:hypothetical protein